MKENKTGNFRRCRLVAFSLAALIAVGSVGLKSSASEAVREDQQYSVSEASDHSRSFFDIYFGEDKEESTVGFERDYKTLANISNKSVYGYSRKSVTVLGQRLAVASLYINGINYIPFRSAASAIGAAYNYNSATKTSSMSASGLTLTASAGCYVIYANDRPLFTASPVVIMNDGRMYIPIEIFAKATGLGLTVSGENLDLSGKYSPLKPATHYYREDEVLWLARIIEAESSGEPLLGKIAVGNVVLNRVKSPEYPNTIYGVIFDRKYGVQFSPILNGSIYNTPSYNSVLAAKICLEGSDVSEGALFFLQPRLSTSSWIPSSRPYAFTIGGHDFYK